MFANPLTLPQQTTHTLIRIDRSHASFVPDPVGHTFNVVIFPKRRAQNINITTGFLSIPYIHDSYIVCVFLFSFSHKVSFSLQQLALRNARTHFLTISSSPPAAA